MTCHTVEVMGIALEVINIELAQVSTHQVLDIANGFYMQNTTFFGVTLYHIVLA